MITGGSGHNTVAESCDVVIDRRLLPGMSRADAEAGRLTAEWAEGRRLRLQQEARAARKEARCRKRRAHRQHTRADADRLAALVWAHRRLFRHLLRRLLRLGVQLDTLIDLAESQPDELRDLLWTALRRGQQ